MACAGASSAFGNYPPPQPTLTGRRFCTWAEFHCGLRHGWTGLTYFTFTSPNGGQRVFLCEDGVRAYFGQGEFDLGPAFRTYYKMSLLWPAFAQAWSARQERLVKRGIARVRIRNIAKYHNLPEDIERVILTYIG